MKLSTNKIITISICFSLLFCNAFTLKEKITSNSQLIEEKEINLNFFSDVNYEGEADPTCKVGIKFDAKNCQVAGETFATGSIIFTLKEVPDQDDDVSTTKGKGNADDDENNKPNPPPEGDSSSGDGNSSFIQKMERENSSKNSGIISMFRKALSKVGQAFRYRFSSISSKAGIESQLFRKKKKEGDSNNGNNYKPCIQKLRRLALNHRLDVRYINECSVTITQLPTSGFSIRFTVNSRESQESSKTYVELDIPKKSSVEEAEIREYVKSITSSCKSAHDKIKKFSKILETNYCKKKVIPKSFSDCNKIQHNGEKTRCLNIFNDLNKAKSELLESEAKIITLEKNNSNLQKKKLSLISDDEVYAKEREEILNKVKEAEADIKKQEEEFEALRKEVEAAGQAVLDQKKKAEEVYESIKKTKENLETANNISQKQIEDEKLRLKLANAVNKEIDNLQSEVTKLKEDQKVINSKINAAQNTEVTLNASANESDENYVKSQDELKELEKRKSLLEGEMTNLNDELKKFRDLKAKSQSNKPSDSGTAVTNSKIDKAKLDKEIESQHIVAYDAVPDLIKSKIEESLNLAKSGDVEGADIIKRIVNMMK